MTARRTARRRSCGSCRAGTRGCACSLPAGSGAAAATTSAWRRPRGEYIARQDFDDRSYPDRLQAPGGVPRRATRGRHGWRVLPAGRRAPGRALRPHAADRRTRRSSRPWPSSFPSPTPSRPFGGGRGARPAAIPRSNNLIDLRFYLRRGQAGVALRQRPGGGGRALRPRLQLVPPHVQVHRPAAGSGAGPGPGGPRAGAPAVDVPVSAGPPRLRVLPAPGSSAWCAERLGGSKERDL